MNKIKNQMLIHESHYSKYACLDKDAMRLHGDITDDDIRPNYYRDIDRIIHSLSYTRYIDKTQVFSNKSNDHIQKRIIHVQLVSKVARTIGRALGLNEDLIEAIALGHDIGHVPFGHVGESFLNELSLKYDGTYFMHNVESVRELNVLEAGGKGKNLTVQVLDGILCHNGEFVQEKYKPIKKTKEDFIKDYELCYTEENYSAKLIPMTMEGCVVRISDVIAYLGRDIEDAIRLGLLYKKEIPKSIKNIIGDTNKDIMNHLINDVIENSYNKPYISMSKEVYQAVKDLKDFNYVNIYAKAYTKLERAEIKRMFNTLFKQYLSDLRHENRKSEIYKAFIDEMNKEYNKNTSKTRKVIDFIAGM
ncbi:MAG: HD domain-containing protein, partial [Bacilli bacterium]|nr:HD domain-containing protein [Bacilli bacterium]